MSLFHNTADRTVTFELLERRFTLEPGAELEFPAEHAWLLTARQLPLSEGPSPLGASASRARVERVILSAPPRAPDLADDLTDTDEEPGEPEAPATAPAGEEEADLERALAAAAANLGPRRAAPTRRARG